MSNNKLYAFDFDGVICDSVIETGMSAWLAAQQIWSDLPNELPEPLLLEFRHVRPVLETGYQAILILRLLFERVPTKQLAEELDIHLERLMIRDDISKQSLKQLFGEVRDNWIANDLSSWIAMNPLFNDVADKLNTLAETNSVIITTKQQRFVKQILLANNIHYPANQIYGLERNMSKPNILVQLLTNSSYDKVIFIEDRLATLKQVLEDSRLNHIDLILAEWGYNSDADKLFAANNDRIQPISLPQLTAI